MGKKEQRLGSAFPDPQSAAASAAAVPSAAAAEATSAVPKKQRHRKDKPWDDASIDHWAIQPWTDDDDRSGAAFLEESSFATLFPKYREIYLRDNWPAITKALERYGIGCELNLVEGSMSVKTTRKTRDPYAIIKARDLLRLLARSVPYEQALKIMQDEFACDIVKIGGLVRNKERFVKRRQRLIGPNGATLKALELLTNCYICVQGNTVAVMGDYKGLKNVRRIIVDAMNNIHPVYHIKELMIKRELAKDDKLKDENWDRFLPHFRARSVALKEKRKRMKQMIAERKAKKKEYTPFPPAPIMSKIDKQIESGEYFLSKEARDAQQRKEKETKKAEKLRERERERASHFIAPKEPEVKRRPEPEHVKTVRPSATGDDEVISSVRERIGKAKRDKDARDGAQFVAPTSRHRKASDAGEGSSKRVRS